MRSTRLVQIVSCHCEGEVGDVVVGGVAPPPGETLWAQSRFIASDRALRDFLLREPRAGVHRHVNLLVPPKDPKADAGFIIMEPEDTPPMSGSNAICVATVLLDTGVVPMVEPVTRLTLEAPGGVIAVEADCRAGKAQRITLRNVPSFADRLDAALEVEGVGTLTIDTAYGGDSFVLADAAALGFRLVPDEARDLVEAGVRILAAANRQIGFRHPLNPEWSHLSFCQFTQPIESVDGIATGRNTVVIQPGKLDRSPCGTGCSARMAVLHARGALAAGSRFRGLSIIGSRFDCQVVEETEVGGKRAIVPSLSGRAWVTGTRQEMLDPEDPFPSGYSLSDTWPKIY